MPNNCLSVLYKHIIQVENKNVGLKVGGRGNKHIIAPPPPPPASYASVYCFSHHTAYSQNLKEMLYLVVYILFFKGNDSISECVVVDGITKVFQSYNDGVSNTRLQNVCIGLVVNQSEHY